MSDNQNNELRNVLSDGLTELFSILLFGVAPQKTFPVGQEQEDEFVPRFRFSAYYNLFGDGDGFAHMARVLKYAVDEEQIVDYDVLLNLTGYMGIQTVTFTFDVDMPGETGFAGVTDKAEALMNEIIGDSDVEVYGVTVLNAPDDSAGDEPHAQWELNLLAGRDMDDNGASDAQASDEALAVLREKLTGETREQTARRLAAAASQDAWDTDPEPGEYVPQTYFGDEVKSAQVEEQELNTIDHNPGKELCYDDWSGRYFYADMNHIDASVNKLNAIITSDGEASLNDFYDVLGLTGLPMGLDFGWSGEHVLLTYGSFVSPNGKPALTFSFRNSPKPNLGQYR
jgi:hypothetical protein